LKGRKQKRNDIFPMFQSLLLPENPAAFAGFYSTFALMQKWSKKSRLHKKV
jgi:hypothetical protein